MFTRMGRIRRHLDRASREIEENVQVCLQAEPLWETIGNDADWLNTPGKALADEDKALQIGVLSLLVWRNLHIEALESALQWYPKLQAAAPRSGRTFQLHWELLSLLDAAGRHNSYLEYARKFLRDTRVQKDRFQQAAKLCVHVVYSTLGAAACNQLIKKANRSLLKSEWIQAAKNLCTMPESYSSLEEVKQLHRRASPEDFMYSPNMQVDALILAARSREWESDITGMVDYLAEAAEIGVIQTDLQYWRSRAALQTIAHGREAADESAGAGPSPRGERLAAAWALRLCSDPESAQAVLPLIGCDLEKPEEDMILLLLEQVLRVSFADSPDLVAQKASICASVEEILQLTLPFTQFALAFKTLRLDRNYASAQILFESHGVVALAHSSEPRSAARILNGDFPRVEVLSLVDSLEKFSPAALAALPELAQAKQLVALIPGILAGHTDELEQLRAVRPLPESPEWLGWLFFRLCVIALPEPEIIRIVDEVGVNGPATTWDLAFWVREGASHAARLHPVLAGLENELQTAGWGDVLRPKSTELGLGSVPDQLIRSNQQIARQYNRFRVVLRERKTPDATRILQEISTALESSDILIQSYWKPVATFWRGVIMVGAGDETGVAELEKAGRSWLAGVATAQLSLWAIQNGELTRAEELLTGIREDYAAAAYAHALLLSRQGETDQARAEAQLVIDRFEGCDSVYCDAAQRLAAALCERNGEPDEARRIYREHLKRNPDDSTAAVRMLRLLLHEVHAGRLADDDADRLLVDKIMDARDTIGAREPMFPVLEKLASILLWDEARDPTETMDAARVLGPGGQHLFASRLLACGRAAEALQVIGDGQRVLAGKVMRAVLESWHELQGLWSPGKPESGAESDGLEETAGSLIGYRDRPGSVADSVSPRLERYGRELESLGTETEDDEVRAWRARVELALSMARDSHDKSGNAKDALDRLRALGVENFNAQQQALAAAIDAMVAGDQDRFSKVCDLLEFDLNRIPVDGVEIWLVAADHWFASQDWEQLLDAELPECVEDLSDPRVRTLIAMAYARSCAEDVGKGAARVAIQKLAQARGTLEPMLELEGD